MAPTATRDWAVTKLETISMCARTAHCHWHSIYYRWVACVKRTSEKRTCVRDARRARLPRPRGPRAALGRVRIGEYTRKAERKNL